MRRAFKRRLTSVCRRPTPHPTVTHGAGCTRLTPLEFTEQSYGDKCFQQNDTLSIGQRAQPLRLTDCRGVFSGVQLSGLHLAKAPFHSPRDGIGGVVTDPPRAREPPACTAPCVPAAVVSAGLLLQRSHRARRRVGRIQFVSSSSSCCCRPHHVVSRTAAAPRGSSGARGRWALAAHAVPLRVARGGSRHDGGPRARTAATHGGLNFLLKIGRIIFRSLILIR